ncbi:DUF3320 domain-containing protein [Azotosporobacter soli]|uniref:DUF3320 domain-containing protein n=1 Tax=Azotosporobacter soli TaxID=3055040 RepID=UPI0031FE5D01
MPEGNAVPAQLKKRIDEWRSRLIDLSKRNQLLNYRKNKSSTLEFREQDLNKMYEHLAGDGASWKVFMPAEPELEEQQLELLPEKEKSKQLDLLTDTVQAKKDELISGETDPTVLKRILTNLFRKSREEYQERGVHVLHLGLGMLKWSDPLGGAKQDSFSSPLLLCPVTLNRENANKPFELALAEEDLILNPALAVKLKKDYQLELPELDEAESELPVGDYLAAVRAWLPQDGWEVEPLAVLGMFSFEKLGMYHDLEKNIAHLAVHPAILGLSGVSRDGLAGGEVADVPLDECQKPEETYQILDADSSQQQCIQAVLQGRSLVLQGPPGTGKSQTIANIIAEFLARKKTVLFVSEKMAALEVVYKRLDDRNLGHYCLELHSRKANKKEVLAELKEAAEQSPKPQSVPSAADYQKLQRLRQELNDYVAALHEERLELGGSVYDVMALVARHVKAPLLTLGVEPERLTSENCQRWQTEMKALSRVWGVVTEGDDFPWRGAKETVFRPEVREKWMKLLRGLQETLTDLRGDANAYSQKTGLPLAVTLEDVDWLIQVAELIDQGVVPAAIWLTTDGMADIMAEAKRYGECSRLYWQEKEALEQTVEKEYFSLPEEFEAELQAAWDAVRSMFPKLDADGRAYKTQYRHLADFAAALPREVEECRQYATGLLAATGVSAVPETPQELFRLAEIMEHCFSELKPEKAWLNSKRCKEVSGIVEAVKPLYAEYNRRREELLVRYEETIFDVDAVRLLESFNHWSYQGVFKFFNPGYYAAKKEIVRCTKDFCLPDTVVADLLSVRALQALSEKLATRRSETSSALGSYFCDAATRFDEVEAALKQAEGLLELNDGESFVESLAGYLSTEAALPKSYQAGVEALLKQRQRWQCELQELNACVVQENWLGSGVPFWQLSFGLLEEWSRTRSDGLREAAVLLDDLLQRYGHAPDTVKGMQDDLRCLARLRGIQAELQREENRLQDHFGHRFTGVTTRWDEVMEAIKWTLQLRRLLPGEKMSDDVIRYLTNLQRAPEAEATKLKNSLAAFSLYFAEQFKAQFASERPMVNGESRLALVELKELAGFFRTLEERVDELDNWVEYVQVKGRLAGQGLQDFVAQAEAELKDEALLLEAFARAFYQAQVNDVFGKEPRLLQFRGRNHQQLIEEFKDLDRKLVARAPLPIMEACNQNKPMGRSVISANTAEINVLRTEAEKKRRHMPLMKLFQKIPNLLLRLKPCLMMSPLSVSQYIQPDCFSFDLVIFDEASQIFTEDAVVAMYRGKQVVIAGDSKQMPPTNFFRAAENGDAEYNEEDEDETSSADFSSVLDECGPIFPTSMLRWHYRSKHESLIAFSNHQFYGSKLVTFPAAQRESEELGIQFEYVPDGIYERGGKKINPVEAQRVAEIVIEHHRRRPDKSIGVVAFSQSQMMAIQDVLDLKRQKDPSLETLFKENRLDGFFCKNLENVQGDERDIIIFSVGYGKDAQGKMAMNFGPLNKDGGERRLNVAITRAREKVVLVSSIKAGDMNINATKAAGVLNLYQYLRFAELGESALELNNPGGLEDTDSPFEDDVIEVIRQLGYTAIPQVGCSGYRIDIGVVHPAQPGKFILGVECDGRTYHSAPTARDRDRLRQQVLEGLGWRFHRIWSPDWFQRREAGIESLKAALELAVDAPVKIKRDDSMRKYQIEVPLESVEAGFSEESPMLNGTEVYQSYTVGGVSSHYDFHQLEARWSHISNMTKLAKQEGPIHIDVVAKRLADAWSLARVGSKIRRTVDAACEEAQQQGAIRERNGFLWPLPLPEQICVRVPIEGRPESQRKIEHIASEEICQAMQLILQEAIGISRESLIQETARLFGFQRSGEQVQARLEECLSYCLDNQTMVVTGESITLGS